MNNKGQSLVAFILVVPVILMILFMVYDTSNMVLVKDEMDNINYLTIDYGLDKINDDDLEDKLRDMINKNLSDVDMVKIDISDNKINIVMYEKIENKLSLINKFDILDIKSSYVGYIDNDKKIIRKDK